MHPNIIGLVNSFNYLVIITLISDKINVISVKNEYPHILLLPNKLKISPLQILKI